MSAIGEALARGLAALGGPGPAAALVVGGLVVGALGGGFVAANGAQGVTSSGELAVYACPNTGSPLVKVPGGQRLLATGRTEDSTWLRIHYPDPGRTEGWVEANPLQPSGSIAGLPVADCMPERIALVPSFDPLPTLTTTQDNAPTPSPTSGVTPTPTPGPTATPRSTPRPTATPNTRPDLGSLTVSTRKISFDTGDYCPNAQKTAVFRVNAEDRLGVQSVALFWREPEAGAFTRTAMARTAGTARDGTWQASLNTQANGINRAGSLAYYAVATDTDGATRRLPNRGSDAITVAVCRNEGPDITQVRSSGGNPLYWDPLGSPNNCQTASNITAQVRDPQGVDSVRLFWRGPADGGFRSKPMTLTGGRWFANLDTLGDKIFLRNPPSGTLRWYIQATDDEGKSSRIDTRNVTIRRCDTESTVRQFNPFQTPLCPSRPTFFYGGAGDPDGINGSSADFIYTYVRKNGTKRTVTVPMPGNNDGDWYYQVSVQPGAGWSTNRDTFTYYMRTTDQWGGTTRTPSEQTTVTNC